MPSAATTAAPAAYADYSAAIEDPNDRRGRHRRAAALSPDADARGARRRASTSWSRSRHTCAWRTTRRSSPRATGPDASCSSAKTITTSRSRCSCGGWLPDGAIGEMVFAHFTTIAQQAEGGRRLAQRRDDGRRRRVLRGRHSLARISPAASVHASSTIARVSAADVAGEGPGHARQEHAGRLQLRQRRRRLAVLLARNSVAVPRPAALEAVRPSAASSRSNRTDCSCSSAGEGLPRLRFPGFSDIRGYRAMYRDFVRAIREGRAPEMSLERAMDDQRLMDQIYASLRSRRLPTRCL